ncbi:MAG: succinate dehydrogenase, cytochrome b556 subunit [Sulfuriflexus sp.]|nr:succinate dehydrogenase, cytochrome b556 subunit [Sulfuriflexus sp.]
MLKQKRPVFLNLMQIRFPITAIMSIAHRLTGVLLFLVLPFLIYALERSLQNEAGLAHILEYLDSIPVKIILALLVWSLLHHLLAGIRYLLLDIDIGIEKQQARSTAWLVIVLALIISAVMVGASL